MIKKVLSKLSLAFVFLTFLGSLFCVPAMAASHDGTGSGGGGGGGTWYFDGAEKLHWATVTPPTAGISSWHGGGTSWTFDSGYDIAAYVTGGGAFAWDWIPFDWLLNCNIQCNFSPTGSGSGVAYELPAVLQQQANADGYWLGAGASDRKGFWYNPSNGRYLDAIYHIGRHWITKESYNTVVVFAEEGVPGDMTTKLDCRSWSNEQKFNSGTQSTTYAHTTQPGDVTDSYTVHAIIQTVKKTETYWQYTDGHISDYSCTYSITANNEQTKNINYNVTTPDIQQDYYRPLNLNREGYAEVGDSGITSDFVGGTPLDGSVTNAQNKSDNTAIETLDINADTNFTLRFNNDVLGLDASKDWTTAPPDLANGTWEAVTGGAYANGRNKASGDYYRYNLTLNGAISTDISKPQDTASIVVNGDECTASETYKSFLWQFPVRVYNAAARFIYMGQYMLKAGVEGARLPDWWTATYATGSFFEYGVSYTGVVNAAGIGAPSLTGGQANLIQDATTYYLNTDANAKQRGLYVGIKTQDMLQPIVCGTFDVKTVAGDLHN